MRSFSRRDFLQDSAFLSALLAGAGLGDSAEAASEAVATKAKGAANDKLRVACVGVHGRGMSHVHGFANQHNCIISTICDADSAVIDPAMRHVEKVQGAAPKFEQDIRRVVEDK